MIRIASVFFVLCAGYLPVSAQSSVSVAMPAVLVYKTKADYRNLVPVQISPDGKSLISYPDPADVRGGNVDCAPTQLHKGYLLDRRGIGWRTAYLRLTYDEYAKLSAPPSEAEMLAMIVDKNPLTVLYNCGSRERVKNQVHKINDWIDEGKIGKYCSRIKQLKD